MIPVSVLVVDGTEAFNVAQDLANRRGTATNVWLVSVPGREVYYEVGGAKPPHGTLECEVKPIDVPT